MLGEMTFRRFLDWKAFDKIEPLGGLRGDWQAAQVVATMMNYISARTGSRRRWRPQDCLIEYGQAKEGAPAMAPDTPAAPRQTWQEQKMIGMMYAAMFNSEPKKPQRRRR